MHMIIFLITETRSKHSIYILCPQQHLECDLCSTIDLSNIPFSLSKQFITYYKMCTECYADAHDSFLKFLQATASVTLILWWSPLLPPTPTHQTEPHCPSAYRGVFLCFIRHKIKTRFMFEDEGADYTSLPQHTCFQHIIQFPNTTAVLPSSPQVSLLLGCVCSQTTPAFFIFNNITMTTAEYTISC